MLDFGVDVFAPDFNAAHSKASDAMDAMIAELKERGVKDADIQATEFSIQPVEDEVEGRKVLVGYRVSNSATAKLRDTGAVRIVIYEMIAAGGGSARIDGIGFTLEDPNSKRDEVLALAIADAEARAERVAGLTDVEVGELIYISEGALTYTEPAVLAGFTGGGNVEFSLSVQAAFAIVHDTPMPTATPTPTSEPTAVPTPTATPDPRTDDEKTIDYVERAIARYDRDGRDAAFAYYNSQDSLEGERALFVFEPDTFIIWVTLANPAAIGIPLPNHGEPTAFMKAWIAATESGEGWLEYQGTNYRTGQNEPKRGFGKVHDGHIFISSHSNLQQNIGDTTKNYVNKAIKYYEDNGRQATIDHYNSRDSLEGYFYLFLMDENDIYLAHPIRTDLRGTDIKDVTGKDFDGNYFELGKAIAKADENGIWVEYLWLNPVSGKDEAKTTWAIRHDGLIFASGYYQPLPDEQLPPWIDADPRKYTEDYVNRAIARYERDGLQAMKDYYNSVASYEGEWYLFATDANDIYHVHPLVPRLIGTDIKDVVGKDINGNPGFELGKELAKAGEGQGVWVEYLWPHPATTKEAKKVSYAVRKDGMLFATGYYPAPKDKPAHVRNFVQGAIDVYKSDGLDGVKNLYGKGENSDGLWFLQVLDENAVYLVHGSVPSFVGIDARTLPLPADVDGNPLVPQVLAATEDGVWINIPWPAVNGPENLIAHLWVVKHDGYFFGAAYYDSLSYVRTRDRITEDYVKKAIKYYQDNGQAATVARYNSPDSIEGERYMVLMKPAGDNLVTLLTYPLRPTA